MEWLAEYGLFAAKALTALVAVFIILVMVVAIFVLRQFFHAETQQEDPASVEAPDNTAGEGSAPAQ